MVVYSGVTMVEAPDVYEPTAEETVSDTVVRALADSKGVDPAQLDVRLYDVVDPDALDRLCESGGGGCRVAFTYADRRVVVDGAGTVHVTGQDRASTESTVNPQVLRGAASPWRMVFNL
jgi:hypothetical protein